MSILVRTGTGINDVQWKDSINAGEKVFTSGKVWQQTAQGGSYTCLQRTGEGINDIQYKQLKMSSPGDPQYSSDISAADTITLIDSSLTMIMLSLSIPILGLGTRGVYLRATTNHNANSIDARSCIVSPGSYSSSGKRTTGLSRGSKDDAAVIGNFLHIFNEANKLTIRNKADGCWITIHLLSPTQTSSYEEIIWEDSDKTQIRTNIPGAATDNYNMYNYLHDRDSQPFDLYFNKEW